MYNQFITFSSVIGGKRYNIHINGKQLSMDNFILNLEHNVTGIVLGADKFFLVFADLLSDGNISSSSRIANNINAYDYNGKYLYNIGDIVTNNEIYTYAIMCEIKPDSNYSFITDVTHEYLSCSTFNGKSYIIDITENKLIISQDSR